MQTKLITWLQNARLSMENDVPSIKQTCRNHPEFSNTALICACRQEAFLNPLTEWLRELLQHQQEDRPIKYLDRSDLEQVGGAHLEHALMWLQLWTEGFSDVERLWSDPEHSEKVISRLQPHLQRVVLPHGQAMSVWAMQPTITLPSSLSQHCTSSSREMFII